MTATCTGCARTAEQTGAYDPVDDPVEEDGTYADGKFVCDECYVQLVMRGMDKGPRLILQERAAAMGRARRERVAGSQPPEVV